MEQRIIENIDNPQMLEKLYRENKQEFSKYFNKIYESYNSDLVNFWKLRLSSEQETGFKEIFKLDLLVVIFISLITWLLVKIPIIFPQIQEETFYIKDLAIIVFNGIILYVFWQNRISNKKNIILYFLTILILLFYVNFLPYQNSDSAMLAFIHVPLLLWCIFGLSFLSFDYKNITQRINFIRFNGELLIMSGLILIAGGLLTAITLGLFASIEMDIEKFYFNYVAALGAVASPIISYYLIRL